MTREDYKLAVDGLAVGLYRVGGDVEDPPYLSVAALVVEDPQHGQLARAKLLCVRPLPQLPPAQLTLPALKKFRKHAGVGVPFYDGPRLAEQRPSLVSVSAGRPYRHERQQPDEGRPGAQVWHSVPRREASLQLVLGFGHLPAFRERKAERYGHRAGLGYPLQPEPLYHRVRLARERLGLLQVPLVCGDERQGAQHSDSRDGMANPGKPKSLFELLLGP